MRIIPVIDILRGTAVHARRGERAAYRPVESVLVRGADPLALLRAYCRVFEPATVYVADLDAIMGLGNNFGIIAEMAASDPQRGFLVDAGIRSAQRARHLLRCGAAKIVIASESLERLDIAAELLAAVGPETVTFSIDLRDRLVLWREGSTEPRDPYELAARLMRLGVREAILLEMDKIGTAGGADWTFLGRIIRAAPSMRVIVGGGIKTAAELQVLQRAGASGVLLATALHDGTITREDLVRVGVDP